MILGIDNARTLMELLADEGFIGALTDVEEVLADVDETLDRVEQIEGEAEQAVREANEALAAVDDRIRRFDDTLSLLEAKIEAGFSVAFLLFGVNRWNAGEELFALVLFVLGLLGTSSLVVTIVTLPQVQRLRRAGEYARTELDRLEQRATHLERSRDEPAPSDDTGDA